MSILKKDSEIKKGKRADFTVNKGLNKYRKENLFKEKVEKANHILKTVGLPKGF